LGGRRVADCVDGLNEHVDHRVGGGANYFGCRQTADRAAPLTISALRTPVDGACLAESATFDGRTPAYSLPRGIYIDLVGKQTSTARP